MFKEQQHVRIVGGSLFLVRYLNGFLSCVYHQRTAKQNVENSLGKIVCVWTRTPVGGPRLWIAGHTKSHHMQIFWVDAACSRVQNKWFSDGQEVDVVAVGFPSLEAAVKGPGKASGQRKARGGKSGSVSSPRRRLLVKCFVVVVVDEQW